MGGLVGAIPAWLTTELAKMGAAALKAAKGKWQALPSYVVGELQKIAQTIVTIKQGVADGDISQADAPVLMDMQKHAAIAAIAAAGGMGASLAGIMIDAALDAAATDVNNGVGFQLLS